ncbi:unnamed protein product [Caenorhabditis bovis]|uniref:Uncharacterized protein n=1 Tax=Caenorhabditis bovis TaxID=2654633 RepID=A0A8S1EZ53_9PELO|nr:unnamed protein product [Caenorhabditis bovis]
MICSMVMMMTIADAPLMFDRGNIEHHAPLRILTGQEIAKRLAEQENVHPQERNENDDYVNEKPDEHEQDYKEH